MLKNILRALGHFLAVLLVLMSTAALVGYTQHASISLGDAPLAYKVGGEGPYVFYETDTLSINYIRGDSSSGFQVDTQHVAVNSEVNAEAYFALDGSTFDFTIYPLGGTERAIYNTSSPILAISDLEGNYKALRDFLIANSIITPDLNWAFGEGHVVLLGDMVDRGFSTTQLLWFIYKLEQEASLFGGKVHYIIGNHEIKNMQGNVSSAADKYIPIAGILDRSSSDLLGSNAFLGRWLETKNVIERINGHLFVHGGLHPDIIEQNFSIEELNNINRAFYKRMYYPGIADERTSLVISTQTGPAWYRGYFKDDVTEKVFEKLLLHFESKSVTVGHTIQFKVNGQFQNRLFAIDVKHPNDYRTSIPFKRSEGLLIEDGRFYRVLDDGEKIEL